MDLNDVAMFVKVVEAGSFTKAASVLEAPKSTVSAKVAALERSLGVSLLNRTTRKLNVTAEGEAFYQACVAALNQIEAAEAMVTVGQKAPHGLIKVTVPNSIGEHFMPVFLKTFLGKYPDIKIGLIVTNRFVDLVGEGVDLALRAGELKDSSLVARKIGVNQRSLFAAPEYLARAGSITHPSQLKSLECLGWGSGAGGEWRLKSQGKVSQIKLASRLVTDDLTTLKELAAHGHGIALLPKFFTHDDVVNGRLLPVLPEWSADSDTMSLVYPAQRYLQARLRIFIDELAKALEADLLQCSDSLARRAKAGARIRSKER